ncbi:MAG: hypothetical protein EZS28_036496, partial [Streblomastix strix]
QGNDGAIKKVKLDDGSAQIVENKKKRPEKKKDGQNKGSDAQKLKEGSNKPSETPKKEGPKCLKCGKQFKDEKGKQAHQNRTKHSDSEQMNVTPTRSKKDDKQGEETPGKYSEKKKIKKDQDSKRLSDGTAE